MSASVLHIPNRNKTRNNDRILGLYSHPLGRHRPSKSFPSFPYRTHYLDCPLFYPPTPPSPSESFPPETYHCHPQRGKSHCHPLGKDNVAVEWDGNQCRQRDTAGCVSLRSIVRIAVHLGWWRKEIHSGLCQVTE